MSAGGGVAGAVRAARAFRAFRAVRAAWAAGTAVALLGGCWHRPPNDAWINETSTSERVPADRVPTAAENERMLAAIRDAATPADATQDAAAANPPAPGETVAPARWGRRWHDVLPAVGWSAGLCGMAIWQKELSDDGRVWTFQLITAEDERGTLVVTRQPPPGIYKATATIGMFGEKGDKARKLLEALDATMLRYGEKPEPKIFDD